MQNGDKEKFSVKRIGGHLHKIIPISDHTGEIINHVISPLMVELRLHDIMQIIVGAATLAIPVAFTEEVWNLGERLPLENVLLLSFMSFPSSMRKCNTWRKGLMAGTLGGYGKKIQAHES